MSFKPNCKQMCAKQTINTDNARKTFNPLILLIRHNYYKTTILPNNHMVIRNRHNLPLT